MIHVAVFLQHHKTSIYIVKKEKLSYVESGCDAANIYIGMDTLRSQLL